MCNYSKIKRVVDFQIMIPITRIKVAEDVFAKPLISQNLNFLYAADVYFKLAFCLEKIDK